MDLRDIGTIRNYTRDECIVREGDVGNEMFLLLSGRAGVFVNAVNGLPYKVAELGPGEIFGEMSILDNAPRSATIIALSDLEAFVLVRENFSQFISLKPDIAMNIMSSLSDRIRNADKVIFELQNKMRNNNTLYWNKELDGNSESSSLLTGYSLLLDHSAPNYHIVAQESHRDYLFEEDMLCPVCGKEFCAKKIRLSMLNEQVTGSELRCRSQFFDPLWYSLAVCPSCFYANYIYSFSDPGDIILADVDDYISKLKGTISIDNIDIKTIDHVIREYHLALASGEFYHAPILRIARLWLNLAWIYDDCKDNKMTSMSASRARTSYTKAYQGVNDQLGNAEEQQYSMIMAELYRLEGKSGSEEKHTTDILRQMNGYEAYGKVVSKTYNWRA